MKAFCLAAVIVILACSSGCSGAPKEPRPEATSAVTGGASSPTSTPQTTTPTPTRTRGSAIYANVTSASLSPCTINPTLITEWATDGSHHGKAAIKYRDTTNGRRTCAWALPSQAKSSIELQGNILITYAPYTKEKGPVAFSGRLYALGNPKQLIDAYYDEYKWYLDGGPTYPQRLTRRAIARGAVSYGSSFFVAQRKDLWFTASFVCDEASTSETCRQAAERFTLALSDGLGT